jgi:hypothetical protein
MKRILALIITIFFLTNAYSAEGPDALNGAVNITGLSSIKTKCGGLRDYGNDCSRGLYSIIWQ